MNTPDYQKIYRDMIRIKYPEKEAACSAILKKRRVELMDIIRLNDIITGNKDEKTIRNNQKLKSYDKKAIFQMLDYQKKHRLNNTQLARHFKLSRNTVAKWKQLFV